LLLSTLKIPVLSLLKASVVKLLDTDKFVLKFNSLLLFISLIINIEYSVFLLNKIRALSTNKFKQYLNDAIKSDEITISLNDISTDTINDNYEINSKVLNINSNGIFIITGECNECQILINENLEITLTINSISIDNSNTGPFVISKKSKVNLILVGESTITDNESNEDSESFEGAAIKFKKSSSLSINGDGKLNVNGNEKIGSKVQKVVH